MIHRDINTLSSLQNELVYIDELTGDTITGIVMKKEMIGPNVCFIYVASPYQEQNTKQEGNMFYKDIVVFDDRPNEENGILKDTVLGNYGKAVGED